MYRAKNALALKRYWNFESTMSSSGSAWLPRCKFVLWDLVSVIHKVDMCVLLCLQLSYWIFIEHRSSCTTISNMLSSFVATTFVNLIINFPNFYTFFKLRNKTSPTTFPCGQKHENEIFARNNTIPAYFCRTYFQYGTPYIRKQNINFSLLPKLWVVALIHLV